MFERNHRGYGIARQAKQRNAFDGAESQRFARPHGHLPEMHGVADFSHNIFNKIKIADGNAAGGNNQIGMKSGFKFFLQIGFFYLWKFPV